jgi:hypothetical protein
MSGIGHNSRREPATAWRILCWRRARRDLLPTLPLEIIRTRIARARELGLDYSTYASVRSTSGRDVIALLFSTNALHVMRPTDDLPTDRGAKLAALRDCDRIALVQPPLRVDRVPVLAEHGLRPAAAPAPFAPWGEIRRHLSVALGNLPGDGVLLVGDAGFEREWSSAGRLAGFLTAERYFLASDPA